jgi:hypothetical protein
VARPIPDVDEHVAARAERTTTTVVQVNLDGHRSAEVALAEEQVNTVGGFDASLAAVAEAGHDVALALAHTGQVDADRARVHAVVRAATCEVGGAGAGNHGLGRSAAHVDARAAHVLALDDRRFVTRPRERRRQRAARLACSEHDRVEALLRRWHSEDSWVS